MIPNFEDFRNSYLNVSHETYLKITSYLALLQKWNKTINLISRNLDENSIFHRHILDGLSLTDHIKDKNLHIIDIGSGNGLPAIILAILGYNIAMLEINQKKCVFLQEVIFNLKLNVRLYNCDVKLYNGIKADIITAKAFSSLENIIKWTKNLYKDNTRYLLLKSYNQLKERDKLINPNVSFELQEHPNKYNNDSAIIELKNVKLNG